MNFRFFKVVSGLALGMLCSMTSCNKDNDAVPNENESESVEKIAKDLSESEFRTIYDEISQDTDVVEFSVIDPENVLRRESDRIDYSKSYLQDIKGFVTNSANPPSAKYYASSYYQLVDVDLNMGAGGKYIYLYAHFSNYLPYKTGLGPYTDIYAWDQVPTTEPHRTNMVKKIDSDNYLDCNEGTKKGGPIYLSYTRGSFRPIRGIMVAAYKSKKNSTVGAWDGINPHKNMNQGAGGRYIYIFTLR
ncbi:MAG: hypothetical protein MJZ76_09725 [Bacteroidales bacterium]|nr:hypothetical protein [Bacteroidales bacterium]